jgi:hypothetical protein
VKRRLAEAGIRGLRPARALMLSEAEYERLVEHIRKRRPRLGRPRRSPKEALAGRQGRRLANGGGHILGRPRSRRVVSLDLERPDD